MPSAEFLLGLNLPWLNYGCDFGANAWQPGGGLSQLMRRQVLDEALARIADAGLTNIRWFLLCDGRAGLEEGGGAPRLDSSTLADVDVALEMLARRGLRVMFVVLDFLWCDRPRQVNGVMLGGRGRYLFDSHARERLIDGVIAPLVSHCAPHETVFAWDVMNEPDWLPSWKARLARTRPVSRRAEVAHALGDLVRAIRAHAPQPITVGLASHAGLELVRGIGLDFYQVHWYDRLGLDAVFSQRVASLGLDRPILLGEYPTRNAVAGPATIVAAARQLGYSGAFAWSLLAADDVSSRIPVRPAGRDLT